MKTTDLVTQGAADIKIRLSRKDVFDLCLHEAKGALDAQYEQTRVRCSNLNVEMQSAKKKIDLEVEGLMRKRFAKVIRACEETSNKAPVTVQVHYVTATHVLPVYTRHGSAEKRPSFVQGWRPRHWKLGSALLQIGEDGYKQKAHLYFKAVVVAEELGEIAAAKDFDKIVEELETACDQLDHLRAELTAFEKRSQVAKQALMKRILENSDKGRSVLDLARSLAKEIDLVPSKAIPTSVVRGEPEVIDVGDDA